MAERGVQQLGVSAEWQWAVEKWQVGTLQYRTGALQQR